MVSDLWPVRLVIECGILGFPTLALHNLGEDGLAAVYGSAVGLHYGPIWYRVRWLSAPVGVSSAVGNG